MSNPLPEPVSALRLVVHYALALAVYAALYALVIYACMYWGIEISGPAGAAISLILLMVAASSVGGVWANREKAQPAGGRVWKVAALCSVVALAVQVSVTFASADTVEALRENVRDDTEILYIVLAAIWLVDLLVIRLGFGMGIRQGLRQIERAAAKG